MASDVQTPGPKEYRWDRGHRSVGCLGDCWSVWWRDPSRKHHVELIGRVDTLKEVHATIREHRAALRPQSPATVEEGV